MSAGPSAGLVARARDITARLAERVGRAARPPQAELDALRADLAAFAEGGDRIGDRLAAVTLRLDGLEREQQVLSARLSAVEAAIAGRDERE
jgi:hypothetical protein